jgi:hypothetical protein
MRAVKNRNINLFICRMYLSSEVTVTMSFTLRMVPLEPDQTDVWQYQAI